MHAGLCPAREKMDKDEFLSLSTETMIFLSFSNDYLLLPFPLCFLHSYVSHVPFLFWLSFLFAFFGGGVGCHVAQDSPKFTVTDVTLKFCSSYLWLPNAAK